MNNSFSSFKFYRKFKKRGLTKILFKLKSIKDLSDESIMIISWFFVVSIFVTYNLVGKFFNKYLKTTLNVIEKKFKNFSKFVSHWHFEDERFIISKTLEKNISFLLFYFFFYHSISIEFKFKYKIVLMSCFSLLFTTHHIILRMSKRIFCLFLSNDCIFFSMWILISFVICGTQKNP